MRRTPAAFLCSIALLAACAPRPPELRIAATPPAILLSTAKAGIADGRGRFREIYCAIRADHGAKLPFDRPCDASAALWRLPGEQPPSGRPVPLTASSTGLTVVMVPGLLAECLASESTVFGDARADLQAQGYQTGYIQTRGRQASEINADIIRDAIRAMSADARIVLGHPLQGHCRFPAGARDLSRSRRQGRRLGERGRRRQRLAARRHRA
jgi:hypothetical protein